MTKYILFDTETTGTTQEDRIIQIGAMVIKTKEDIEVFNELCSPPLDIKTEAMEIHNITPSMIENKPPFNETNFYKFLNENNNSNNYLIAHNISFDLEMVEKEGFENKYNLIDTLRCSKHLFSDENYHRLQYLRYSLELYKEEEKEAKNLGITIKAHDAIGDVLVMKLLLSKLVAKVQKEFKGKHPMQELVRLTKTPVMIKKLTFGKYKGRLIEDILKEDKSYLEWMQRTLDEGEDMEFTLKSLLS